MSHDSSTETGSESANVDDFLKDLTWNEVHLFELGFAAGFLARKPRAGYQDKIPDPQTRTELNWSHNKWYFTTGYVLGYLTKATVLGSSALGLSELRGLLPA